MFSDAKRILIISSHADDMEMGCGGVVQKLLKQGKEVFQIILSFNFKGPSSKFTYNDILGEIFDSAEILGLKSENIFVEKFENRIFSANRQKILDVLCKYRSKLTPDMVITSSIDDLHQDHNVVAKESFRAFRDLSIISYCYNWNRLSSKYNYYCALSEEELDNKIKAILSYKSQGEGRLYFSPEYIRSLAITQGMDIKEHYAEAFEIVRLISK